MAGFEWNRQRIRFENLVEHYLIDLGEVRGTKSNVPETSFCPALERLLTAIGKIRDDLKTLAVFQRNPRVPGNRQYPLLA